MKPYLAILIDSFWETVGNKVLWALLLGWSLLLLGLAPFGFISERNFLLSSADITDRGRLVESLAKATQGKGSLAVQAVASHLDEKFRQRLAQTLAGQDSQGQRRITARDLALALNGAIEADELYSDSAFPSAKRRQQTLLPLIEMPRQSMSADELQELNRHLLQLAFPLELRPSRGEQLWIGYAGFKIGEPLSFTRKQIKQFYEPVLLGMIIKLGLGVLAVFVAIVVTSPIIPDTFRSGSLHLLLSKPISRMWLYLFKFLGGCFFVCVNISFVLLGLFVIAGLRFEIWNTGLLACIPLLMFVFLIFYSISALVGLLWGNAIVSVVACLVFWLFCFALGFLHDALLPQVEVWPQIRRIRSIAGELLTVNEKGEFNVWNERFSIWQPALEAEGRRQARTYGPLYLAPQQTIVSKSFHRGSFGRLETSDRKLALIPLGKTREGDSAEPQQLADESPQTVAEARITPVWMSDVGPDLPQQLFNIVEFDDSLLAICRGGLYLLNSDKLELVQATQQGLWGLQLPWLSPSAFENIAPP
ncbi:MAG: ABC transporter permease, partial [Planctomycetales bacterium]|nr:ABC transporter permease [Planctomycetales bacterium]